MNIYKFICIIAYFPLFAQDPAPAQAVGEIKVYSCKKEPFRFYEGQLVSFDFYIENPSDSAQTYQYNAFQDVVAVREESGERINKIFNGWYSLNAPDEELKTIVPRYLTHKQLLPKEKIKRTFVISPWYYGNVVLRDYIGVPDSVFRVYLTDLRFFRPGKYETEIEYRVVINPKPERLKLLVNFEILPTEGKLKEESRAFADAYGNIVVWDTIKHTHDEWTAKKNLFFSFLRNDPTGPYASTLFYILAEESSVSKLYYSPHELFELFEIIPKIKPEIPLPGLVNFFEAYIKWIPVFKESGLIQDEKEYLDNYLKRIKSLDLKISETLIDKAKYILKIEGLTNHSQANK